METELRAISGHVGVETREDGRDYIVFTPIVFNQRSQLLGGWFFEQIDSRALDECNFDDVIGPFNHDPNQILGRSTANTLNWVITPTDVRAEIPVDPTDPDHVRVVAKIKRGDVRGASFAFQIAPGGADWDTDPTTGVEVRTVKKIQVLIDLSPVVNPAYLQTTAGLGKRSLDAIKAEHDSYVTEHRNQQDTDKSPTNEADSAAKRAFELDLMSMELSQ